MALTTEFKSISLDDLRRESSLLKANGWRFVETHAVTGEKGIDLYYAFMRDSHMINLRVDGVTSDQSVPSITDLFLAAFVFENEARELFGVDMRNIAIDFNGSMYAPVENNPMTFISPEQKAAREKAQKAAVAKQEKKTTEEAGAVLSSIAADNARAFKMTPELQARLDAKYPTLSDEKKAKVDAALAARKAEAEARGTVTADSKASKPTNIETSKTTDKKLSIQSHADEKIVQTTDSVLNAMISNLDANKAAKVRAAFNKSTGENDNSSIKQVKSDVVDTTGIQHFDTKLEELIKLMDAAKAAKVRTALAFKGGE